MGMAACLQSEHKRRKLHPLAIRLMHWANAGAMLVMITSGWGIYDDDVIVRGIHFGQFFRLGDWAAWSLNWHFAGMWFLMFNGLCYLIYGTITGRFIERLLPIRLSDLLDTVRDTLRLRVAHDDLTTYNAVQKLLYIIVIIAGISQVVTGLVIWKPVQFSELTSVLGGFQSAGIIHFLGMVVIVGFLVVHVLLALLVPETFWAMLTDGPLVGRTSRGEPMVRP